MSCSLHYCSGPPRYFIDYPGEYPETCPLCFVLFCCWSHSVVLLLSLHSRFPPGSVKGTRWGTGNRTWVSCQQAFYRFVLSGRTTCHFRRDFLLLFLYKLPLISVLVRSFTWALFLYYPTYCLTTNTSLGLVFWLISRVKLQGNQTFGFPIHFF